MNEHNNIYSGRQLHNDIRDLEAISDEYEGKLNHEYWLADALQKDSIQNGWDAKISKRGDGWSMRMEPLQTKNGNFLVIQDSGTSGLTGTIWKTEDELTTILNAKDPKENLAHFLSSNFSAKNFESGGKRGRGKSLFLISSKDSAFYFESIRNSDDIYISGGVFVGQNKAVMVEFSSSNKEYIENILGNKIDPISGSGTRIFIKNPKPELIKALNNGSMFNLIEKTWWEIIKKHEGIKIIIKNGSESKQASIPIWYHDNLINENGLQKKEYTNLVLLRTGNETLRVKRIVLVYNPIGNTPENIQGIAVQRRGMTVERRATEILVKEEGMNKVYGWVEMEEPLENAMYDLEDVEHLSFKWTKTPASNLLDIMKINIRDFAKDVKIIETEKSKQHKAHKQIEEEVAVNINNFLKNLGFSGVASGKRKRSGTTRIPNLPLRISLTEFKTPNNNRKVSFGDKIQAQAVAINELKIPLKMVYRTWIVDANGNTIKIKENEISLNPNEDFTQGWADILILQNEFPMGDYSFKSKITLLEDTEIGLPRIGRLEKGTEIRVSSAFSVEKDPPSHGFIKFEAIESTDKTKYVTTRPENQFVVLEYNTKHPYIAKFMPIERQDELKKFLLEVGIIVVFNQVMAEDISQDNPKIFNDINDDYDLTSVSPRIIEEVSKFMWTQ